MEIPFTPRAKRVLELSLEEARQLGHNYIGTEHILLGLLREGEGVASRVLETLGADPQKIRTQARGAGRGGAGRILGLWAGGCGAGGCRGCILAGAGRLGRLCGYGAGWCWLAGGGEAAAEVGGAPVGAPGAREASAAAAQAPLQWSPAQQTRAPAGLLGEGQGLKGSSPRVALPAGLQVIRMVGESQEPVGSTVGGGSTGSNKMPTLEEYGTNLTNLAEEVRPAPAPAPAPSLSLVGGAGGACPGCEEAAASSVQVHLPVAAGWLCSQWRRPYSAPSSPRRSPVFAFLRLPLWLASPTHTILPANNTHPARPPAPPARRASWTLWWGA